MSWSRSSFYCWIMLTGRQVPASCGTSSPSTSSHARVCDLERSEDLGDGCEVNSWFFEIRKGGLCFGLGKQCSISLGRLCLRAQQWMNKSNSKTCMASAIANSPAIEWIVGECGVFLVNWKRMSQPIPPSRTYLRATSSQVMEQTFILENDNEGIQLRSVYYMVAHWILEERSRRKTWV